MKKLLYVVRYPLEYTYSLMQKINGQIQGMKDIELSVSFLCYDQNKVYLNTDGEVTELGTTLFGKARIYYHFLSYIDLYRFAERVIKSYAFDVVYLREAPYNHFALKLLRSAHNKAKIVIEKPTYLASTNERQKNILYRAYSYYSNILAEKAAQYVDLYVLIGDSASTYRNKPAINIENGAPISQLPLKKSAQPTDDKIHLLAVASMCYWQGFDRLIDGLSKWKSPEKEKYIIDLVGGEVDGSLGRWKELAHQLGIQDQVYFHGYKTGDELNSLFDCATIGISSLGCYRKGLTSASVLKLREYMARGLPFVYAHDDPDINSNLDWCLKISNDSSPVDMDAVSKFIYNVSNLEDVSYKMRDYAEENMSWKKQFTKILEKLNMS